MELPRPAIRDYSLVGVICLLMMLWSLSILQGVAALALHRTILPLIVTGVATVGYVVSIRYLLKLSDYATYLWLRFVERRDLTFVNDKV